MHNCTILRRNINFCGVRSEKAKKQKLHKKPPRKTQGYHTFGRGTIAIQMKEKTTSVDKYIDDRNIIGITSEHPRAVSFLLKGLIRRKYKNGLGHHREIKLSNAVTEKRACKATLCIGITPNERS